MKFRLVKLSRFSGVKTSIYTVVVGNDAETLFDKFLQSHKDSHLNEIRQIIATLDAIGKKVGAQEIFFRRKKEGKAGDGVEALYDAPDAKLRLYCIRYGNVTLVLGDGGEKNVRTWQEDKQLTKSATEMIKISALITQAIREGDLYWNGNEFVGKLNFDEEDE